MKRDVVQCYVWVLSYVLSHSAFSSWICLNLYSSIFSKKNVISLWKILSTAESCRLFYEEYSLLKFSFY